MKTSTEEKALHYIQAQNGTSANSLIKELGLNAAGIFRHLKKMQVKGLIYKIGKPPRVRYYATADMNTESTIFTKAFNWAVSGDPGLVTPEILCTTRDVFQVRNDRLVNEFIKTLNNESLVFLLVGAAGELGNNSFDHNLGHWQDVPGVYFFIDMNARQIILADRGQGVYATIKQVRPNVKDETEALTVAFTERISGRAPEQRGNGLKFVKKITEENKLRLEFFTGQVKAEINASGLQIQKTVIKIPGTLSCISF